MSFLNSTEDAVAEKAAGIQHAHIWKPNKGTVEDQVLIAKAYGTGPDLAINTAIYRAGFNTVWTILPADNEMWWIVMARSDDSWLLRMLDTLPGAAGEEVLAS
jgi:hypothetical protein